MTDLDEQDIKRKKARQDFLIKKIRSICGGIILFLMLIIFQISALAGFHNIGAAIIIFYMVMLFFSIVVSIIFLIFIARAYGYPELWFFLLLGNINLMVSVIGIVMENSVITVVLVIPILCVYIGTSICLIIVRILNNKPVIKYNLDMYMKRRVARQKEAEKKAERL